MTGILRDQTSDMRFFLLESHYFENVLLMDNK